MDNLPKLPIAEGIVTGDTDTILYVYKTLGPKIVGHVINNSGSEEDGKELFQDAYLKAFQALKAGKYREEGKFEQWFNGIAVKLWQQELRHRSRRGTQNLDDAPAVAADDSEDSEQARRKNRYLDALHRALERMKEPCRSMLYRFHAEESVSSQDLAEEMSRTDGAIRVKLARCRQDLRNLLTDELGKDGAE